MTKDEFLHQLESGHAEWEAVLAQIDRTRMMELGVAEDWSVTDVIAHVTWFEREMVGMLRARALVGSDLWNLPQSKRNAAIFEQNRGRSLADVLAESRATFQQLFEAAQSLTDEDLDNASHFDDMPEDWVPWQIIAQNTFEHYPHHIASIGEWLKR